MKRFLIILTMCLFNISVYANSIEKDFSTLIKEANIPQESVAISIKSAETGKTVYEKNQKILMHPGSVQKILTILPIIETLGNDYNFKTELYLRGNDEYIVKLGADPYLKTSDLETLVSAVNSELVKKIIIDNSVIERKDWGEGWQWDDDLNVFMPRFNAYNLDGNLVRFTIMPTEPSKQAFIINNQKSPMIFYNNVITGDKNDIRISRDNITSAETLKLEGIVKTPQVRTVPNNNLKRYFEKKLTDVLENRKIYLKSAYSVSKIEDSDKLIKTVEHPISMAIDDVLLNSNNMVIETMSKLSGGKYYNKQGTDLDGINLFNEYCTKTGIDNSGIRLVDASGVSKNNLVNADFISTFLLKNKDNEIYKNMATPAKGTLEHRMLPLKDNLRAKTGTLSDISSIAGFLTSKTGHKYVFCIIINDPSTKNSQKKSLENYLIREMYLRL